MPFKKSFLYYLVSSILFFSVPVFSQTGSGMTDTWQQALKDKKAAITVLWDEIEPFIYRSPEGTMIGVEYELMEGLKGFVKKHYQVSLDIWWKDAKGFANIYPAIRDAKSAGIFGASYYSITEERKKEVRFSPPYMPDLNILVTNNKAPVFESEKQFAEAVKAMQGYTQPGTTMQEDLNKLRDDYYTGLSIRYNTENDYEVMRDIAGDANGLGYVPVSIYVVALQRGIKVKRQRLFDVRREGFAVIYPKGSDWSEPIDAYFKSDECRQLVNGLIKKYLGDEVSNIILDISATDSLAGKPSDIELLTKEREIVTQRFMDAATEVQKQASEVQRQRSFRNTVLIVLGFLLLLAGLLYSRFRTKQKLNAKLEQRNALISKQNEQIEQMNHLLKLKVLQARMNPHFLFNSLNSIQYFIAADDKKASLQYISRFSAFLRKVIHFGDELSISVNDEAELLREYLWLEHTRFPGQFDYEIILPEESQQGRILPLLTHGLVEAALYRGVLNLADGKKGKIVVDFSTEDHHLLVHVTDNGMSREQASELEKKKGLATGEEDMLSRRIKLFNRNGRKKIHLKLGRDETMNTAVLEIPQPLFDNVN